MRTKKATRTYKKQVRRRKRMTKRSKKNHGRQHIDLI